MSIELSDAFSDIERQKNTQGVFDTLRLCLASPETSLQDLSVLTPLAEEVRSNPNSAIAMNDFAYTLERMDARLYDCYMRLPANKEVVELYNKADRGSEEYRNKLVDETIERGKALIDGFEKETGISLEESSKKSIRLYRAFCKVSDEGLAAYIDKRLKGDPELQDHRNICNEILKSKKIAIYKKEYQPAIDSVKEKYLNTVIKQGEKDLKAFRQYLISKSSISDKEANEWLKNFISIKNSFVSNVLEKLGMTKEDGATYIKDLYRIANGRPNTTLSFCTKKLSDNIGGYAQKKGGVLVLNSSTTPYLFEIAHEFGHFVEYGERKNIHVVRQFLKSRSNDTSGNFVKYKGCKGYIDSFYKEYVGCIYEYGDTECISTGFELLNMNYDFKHEIPYQPYDKEHLAFILGITQNKATSYEEKLYSPEHTNNTAKSYYWHEAVKKAIPSNIYKNLLNGEYTSDWLTTHQIESIYKDQVNVEVICNKSSGMIRNIRLQDFPSGVYLVWGYMKRKFPYNYSCFSIITLLNNFITSKLATYNIVPSWYSIGMTLPEMR